MNKLKLGAKIGTGFGLLVLLAVLLGGLAVVNMLSVGAESRVLAEAYSPEVDLATRLERNFFKANLDMRTYGFTGDPAMLGQAQEFLARTASRLADAKSLAESQEVLVKLREAIGKAEGLFVRYQELVVLTRKNTEAILRVRESLNQAAAQFMKAATEIEAVETGELERELGNIADQSATQQHFRKSVLANRLLNLGNDTRIANLKGQAWRDDSLIKDGLNNFVKIQETIQELRKLATNQDNIKRLDDVAAAAEQYRLAMEEFLVANDALAKASAERGKVGLEMSSLAEDTARAGSAHANDISQQAYQRLTGATWVMVVGLVVAVILGIILAWFITRGITRPVLASVEAVRKSADGDFTYQVDEIYLRRGDELGEMMRDVDNMTKKLSTVVREVALASATVANSANEISNGNQDLSNRTQQQASAIEETASSIEQMTSSVKQNAENSRQANELAKKTASMAQEGGQVVERTIQAMTAVTDSSKKISDIINVVNEIAFQTNLLALNAAVEAARAGEAGRGFAVVAGEVRSLAGRSAQAAKEIQTLITDSVGKIEQGNELVAESGALLNEIIINVQAVADTVGEITASSQEQAQGIDEVNKAVSQMDEAVQNNAALVEEAASSAENLAAAAEEMRSQMLQFKVDQNGGGQARPRPTQPVVKALPAGKPAAPRPAARPAPKPAPKPTPKPAAKSAAKEDDFFGEGLDGFEEF